jgi:hypothetical protein
VTGIVREGHFHAYYWTGIGDPVNQKLMAHGRRRGIGGGTVATAGKLIFQVI